MASRTSHASAPSPICISTSLAMVNSEPVGLVEHDRLHRQLVSLERRTARGGKDTIDHQRGGRDDVANAVAVAQFGLHKNTALRCRYIGCNRARSVTATM